MVEEVKRGRGRPRKYNAKNQRVEARVTLKTVDRLNMMCEDLEKSRSEVISEAINALFMQIYC